MKKHNQKFVSLIKDFNYSFLDAKAYYEAHRYKIDKQTISKEIAKTQNPKYIKKYIATGICDEQLKVDYKLFKIFQCPYGLYSDFTELKSDLVDILSNGANPDRYFDGHTTLYTAINNKYPLWAIEILLDHNASIELGKVVANGNRFYIENPLNESATIGERNGNYDVVELMMKKGYNFPTPICSTTDGTIFCASTMIRKLVAIYNNPEIFLDAEKITDNDINKNNGKYKNYLKNSALYGLRKKAIELKESGELTESYIEDSKELIKQINERIKVIAEKKLQEKETVEQQTILFNKLNSAIKSEIAEDYYKSKDY